MKVLKGRILVKEIPQEEVVNGIIVPKSEQKKGEVVTEGMEVRRGDVVIFKATGTKVKLEEGEYTLLSESDVLYW